MRTTAVATAAAAINPPSERTMLALIPLLMLVFGVMTYCLRDLARAPSLRYLPKAVWALIIILVSFQFGAIAYLVLGKEHHDRHDPFPYDHR